MATKDESALPATSQSQPEDTALTSLTAEDREKLSMDAWEPSLLRNLLKAQNKLQNKRKR